MNLPEDKRENGIIHGTASLFRLMEGGSIYDLYTYEYAGVNPETGAAQWYMDEKDANGKVTGRTVTEDYTQASKYELGSTLPDFQGGFSTDFAYKGIDLSIATNFQLVERYMTACILLSCMREAILAATGIRIS